MLGSLCLEVKLVFSSVNFILSSKTHCDFFTLMLKLIWVKCFLMIQQIAFANVRAPPVTRTTLSTTANRKKHSEKFHLSIAFFSIEVAARTFYCHKTDKFAVDGISATRCVPLSQHFRATSSTLTSNLCCCSLACLLSLRYQNDIVVVDAYYKSETRVAMLFFVVARWLDDDFHLIYNLEFDAIKTSLFHPEINILSVLIVFIHLRLQERDVGCWSTSSSQLLHHFKQSIIFSHCCVVVLNSKIAYIFRLDAQHHTLKRPTCEENDESNYFYCWLHLTDKRWW